MPIYEYRCLKCRHTFDHLARNSTDKVEHCPKCGAPGPEKQFSTFIASVASSNASCSMGKCETPTCSSGACPFG